MNLHMNCSKIKIKLSPMSVALLFCCQILILSQLAARYIQYRYNNTLLEASNVN